MGALRFIRKVTQSPMNRERWCLDLHCGHELWVTAKRRPAMQSTRTVSGEKLVSTRAVTCPQCQNA